MSRRSTPPGRRRDASASRASRAQRASGGRTGRRSDSRLVALVVLVGLALISGAYALGGLTGTPAVPTPGVPTPGPAASAVTGACPTSQPAPLAAGETRTVTIQTSLGAIVIKVDGSLSPIAAGNFVALADCGFYDGLVFHRTASLQDGTPFVIQGGDPSGNGSGGPGYTIQDEPVIASYKRGTVAMARTSQANSQGSQFFIVLDDRDGPVLAQANTYAIFGTVTSGMDVADAIFKASNGAELPANPIAMDSVTVTSP